MDAAEGKLKELELGPIDLETIRNVSLGQLLDQVDEANPEGVSKKRVLRLFMIWLNERLLAIDNSDDDALQAEIGSWCVFIKKCGYEDQVIVNTFEEWKSEQARIEPSSNRRLSLADWEMRSFLGLSQQFGQYSQPLPLANHEAPGAASSFRPDSVRTVPGDVSQGSCEHMHPDRLRLTQNVKSDTSHAVIDVDNWTRPVVELSSDDSEADKSARNLSFLTGANKMVYEQSLNSTTAEENSKSKSKAARRRVRGKRAAAAQQLQKSNTLREKALEGAPPPGYLCNRCGKPGHYLQNCPTNLDPSWDQRPPADYRCGICNSNEHWLAVCPKNRHSDSITMQRRKLGIIPFSFTPDVGSDTGHGDEAEPIHPFSSKATHDGKGTRVSEYRGRRDRSPGHEVEDRRVWDSFRPRYPSRSRSRSPRAARDQGHDDEYSRYRTRRVHRRSMSPEVLGASPSSSPQKSGRLNYGDEGVYMKGRKRARDPNEGRLSYYDEDERDTSPPTTNRHKRPHTESGQERAVSMHCSPEPVEDTAERRYFLDELENMISVVQSSPMPEQMPTTASEWPASSPRPSSSCLDVSVIDFAFKTSSIEDKEDKEDTENRRELPPPIELYVSVKSLYDRDPPYHPRVLELFRDRENVWVNRMVRSPAWCFWEAAGNSCNDSEGKVDEKVSVGGIETEATVMGDSEVRDAESGVQQTLGNDVQMLNSDI